MSEIRLVIKKIPNILNEGQFREILDRNFKDQYFDFNYIKLNHKYDTKNNTMCILSVNSLDVRKSLMEFLDNFEMISKKGQKIKLILEPCLVQQKPESKEAIKDPIEGSIIENEYFLKFKEAFEKDDLVLFKQDEKKCKLILN